MRCCAAEAGAAVASRNDLNVNATFRVRSVEHHHFRHRDRWLLFDVAALRVLASTANDAQILQSAASGVEFQQLVADASVLSPGTGAARVHALADAGFLVLDDDDIQLAELGDGTKYGTFMVNVSQRCNLTCPYCYVNRGHFDYEEKPIPKMRSETSVKLVERIYQLFPGLQTYAFHFYGGEPLLNFRAVREIVEAAEAKASSRGTMADFHITTNGTVLTPEIADFMERHRFTVYFSIDGGQQNHDELRKYINGTGSYADVERNLRHLRTKKGVHLIGSSVVRKGFTLRHALELLESHGASQSKAERVRLRDGDVLSLVNDKHAEYLKDIESLVDHYVNHLEQSLKPMDFRLSSKVMQIYTRKRRDFFCPAGKRMYGISADGEIYPCALHVGRPQSKLGDLTHGVDEAKRTEFRRKFSSAYQADCQSCWTRHLCGGGCSAMVDRFGHEDCTSLRKESEAAIAIYQHFAETDPLKLLGLVSPKVVKWANGKLRSANALRPSEPAAQRVFEEEPASHSN